MAPARPALLALLAALAAGGRPEVAPKHAALAVVAAADHPKAKAVPKQAAPVVVAAVDRPKDKPKMVPKQAAPAVVAAVDRPKDKAGAKPRERAHERLAKSVHKFEYEGGADWANDPVAVPQRQPSAAPPPQRAARPSRPAASTGRIGEAVDMRVRLPPGARFDPPSAAAGKGFDPRESDAPGGKPWNKLDKNPKSVRGGDKAARAMAAKPTVQPNHVFDDDFVKDQDYNYTHEEWAERSGAPHRSAALALACAVAAVLGG